MYMHIAQKPLIADTAIAFNKIYNRSKRPPWDLDGPAQFVRELAEAGEISGEILDVGCGTGGSALYLAARGYRVAAFDGAPVAIEKARAKALEQECDVSFEVADARALPIPHARFSTIIDSGLFHVFARSVDRETYAKELRRVALPGAVVHLLAFQERSPGWLTRLGTTVRQSLWGIGTHGVTKDEVQSAFSEGWSIETIEERHYGWAHFLLARIRSV
jgi:ubiquinone/menaquinone biosynthesis C-methylase UbiE